MVYTLLFSLSLQNAVCFIILTYLVPVLFTFYIQGVLKLKKNNSGAKRLSQLESSRRNLAISSEYNFFLKPSGGGSRVVPCERTDRQTDRHCILPAVRLASSWGQHTVRRRFTLRVLTPWLLQDFVVAVLHTARNKWRHFLTNCDTLPEPPASATQWAVGIMQWRSWPECSLPWPVQTPSRVSTVSCFGDDHQVPNSIEILFSFELRNVDGLVGSVL